MCYAEYKNGIGTQYQPGQDALNFASALYDTFPHIKTRL